MTATQQAFAVARSLVAGPDLIAGASVVTLSGIGSGAAVGQPSWKIGLAGIASTAHVGQVVPKPPLTGIASGAHVGTPTLSPGAGHVTLAGIASVAAVGAPTISGGASVAHPAGIASTAHVGQVAPSVPRSGIASTAAVGTPLIAPGAASLHLSGIPSAAALGRPAWRFGVAGIASTATAGTVGLFTSGGAFLIGQSLVGGPDLITPGVRPQTSTVNGIASTSAVGRPNWAPHVTGVASTAHVGAVAFLGGSFEIHLAGIASAAHVGAATPTSTLHVAGIASTSRAGRVGWARGRPGTFGWGTFGQGTFGGANIPHVTAARRFTIARSLVAGPDLVGASDHQYVEVGGIASTAQVGSIPQTRFLTGIASTNRFGALTIKPQGAIIVGAPHGIASTAAVGTVSLQAHAAVTLSGIASTARVGAFRWLQPIAVAGIGSTARLGVISITRVNVVGIPSGAHVGHVLVRVQVVLKYPLHALRLQPTVTGATRLTTTRTSATRLTSPDTDAWRLDDPTLHAEKVLV